LSCRSEECTKCIYIVGQDIDLRSITLYTQLPELWEIFRNIVSISIVDDSGFTMSGADAYLRYYDVESLHVTHHMFWSIMVYFLNRVNEKFRERRKMKNSQKGR